MKCVNKARDSGFYFKYSGKPQEGTKYGLIFILKRYFLLRYREGVIMGQDWRKNTS